MLNVLVTGSKGFLGKHICEELEKRDIEVIEYDIIDGNDICNIDNLISHISPCDYVIHTAAQADIDESYHHPSKTMQINVVGTTKCLEASSFCFKNYRLKKFIFASSVYVGGNKGSFYKVSKKVCEELCHEMYQSKWLPYVNIRYGSLYGPGANYWNRINDICEKLLDKKEYEYNGSPDEKREYIHVQDAAKTTVDIMLNNNFDNKNVLVTGNESKTVKELFDLFTEILGYDIVVKYKSNDTRYTHYKTTPYAFDNNKVIRLNMSEYTELANGLIQCLENVK